MDLVRPAIHILINQTESGWPWHSSVWQDMRKDESELTLNWLDLADLQVMSCHGRMWLDEPEWTRPHLAVHAR